MDCLSFLLLHRRHPYQCVRLSYLKLFHFPTQLEVCQPKIIEMKLIHGWFMVFNTTFNNIASIVLLVGKPLTCHKSLSHNAVSSTPCHEIDPSKTDFNKTYNLWYQ